ncbi:MAG TPA: hypothetical protein VFZ18_06365 [Longimicrobiaceae bacterium]
MFRRITLLTLPLACLALAACDDTTGPEGNELSASEAAALALALDNASSSSVDTQADAPAQSLSPSNGPSQAVTTRTDDFEFSLPCPRGGTTTLGGEHVTIIDTTEGFITVDVTAAKGHDACAFRTDEGVDVTVNGTLQFVAERELRAGLASASNTHTGSLAYTTSDGKEGTCSIDITTAFTLTPGNATRTILGSVCGHEVDVNTAWTHSS